MKLIKSSFSILDDTNYNIESIYKRIELVGRCCTKSEDKITENSSSEFVDRMIKLGHGAVLEHGTVYLFCPTEEYVDSNGDVQYYNPLERYQNNNYSVLAESNEGMYVTTNLRVLVEGGCMNDLKYLCEPTEYHEKRVCVKFTLPIGISREFCRHRTFSFMELSTRYVNMSGDKVGNEITFIKPAFKPDFIGSAAYYEWEAALMDAEVSYNNLIKAGLKPQVARGVLPLDTKTELYMTGFISDWQHFFHLRSNKYGKGGAHPQADELATPLKEEFIKRCYIE